MNLSSEDVPVPVAGRKEYHCLGRAVEKIMPELCTTSVHLFAYQGFWRKNKAGQWKSAWLSATDETMDMLRVHQKVTGSQPFVFMNMQGNNDPKNWLPYVCRHKFLSELCMKAGVKEFGFHGIRHLFASILATEKRALVEIQMMLRHDHLTTTQRYIHSLNKEGRDVLVALPGPVSRLKSP